MEMKHFFKKIEDIMASVAFAQAGEFETAREFLKENKNTNKRVLLGIEDAEFDPSVIRYAFNLCGRTGAKLEILHVMKNLKPEDVPLSLLRKSFGGGVDMEIDYHVTNGSEVLEQEIARHTAERRDILCVVVASVPTEEKGPKKKRRKYLSEIIDSIKCPVVVSSEIPET